MKPAFPFAAVLFDMDGVIIDNAGLHVAVWGEFARTHGLNPSEADLQATSGRRGVDVIATMFGGQISDDEIAQRATEREILFRQRSAGVPAQAVAGAREFLEALERHGIPRVLATSADKTNVGLVLSRLGLLTAFDAIVSAEDVRNGKPHPEVYLKAAQRAGVAAERCLVVEDALTGVRSAKAAGAFCLGLMTSQSGEALKEAGADWTAPSFLELPQELQLPLAR